MVGINHFTRLTAAQYKNMDLFPIYREFVEIQGMRASGEKADENWLNRFFDSREQVKLDLFLKYGAIAAAAGDRASGGILSRFMVSEGMKKPHIPGGFKADPGILEEGRSEEPSGQEASGFTRGEEEMTINQTPEEGVQQMRSLLGLRDLVTNVNIPNCGQIPNLPLGAVGETNAHFQRGLCPACDLPEPVPQSVYPLISRVCGIQEMTVEAAMGPGIWSWRSRPLYGPQYGAGS